MRELKIEKSITKRSDDSLKRYLQDISKYALISADEEVSLAQKIRNGDEAAKAKLINSNLRFVVSVAKKYEGQGVPLGDLISEGNKGLIKAAGRFDDTRGIKFISFAVWWIRQAMMFSINEHKRLVRLPMNQVNDILQVWKAESDLEQVLERPATTEELAKHCGLNLDKVRGYITNPGHTVALDAGDNDEKPGMLSVLENEMFDRPDTTMDNDGLQHDLQLILTKLTPRQYKVIQMYFGLNGQRPMLIEEIAAHFGLSEQCIQMNKTKAMVILRNTKNIHIMKQYL